ncbi:MAG: MCE family protein [Candidatus Omnitrophica bacterium]|nr:MCE family protein [Candidatus Omnitrophota bacterium]
MDGRTNFELKVGIFVFIGLVILSALIFSIGEFYVFRRGINYNIIFSFANGIELGAPVRVAGVESGEVEDIKLIFDKDENEVRVKIRVWVEESAKVHTDAVARINTLGLLGEKYLEIYPGTNQALLLKPNAVLRGVDPMSTEELTYEGHKTLQKLDQLIESMNEVLDQDTRDSIKKTIANAEDATASVQNIVDSTNDILETIKSGRGTVGKLVYDEALYQELEAFVQEIKAHPWKLFIKGKEEKKKEEMEESSSAPEESPRGARDKIRWF